MTEHLSPKQTVAAGIRALPGAAQAFASTQAAWRFYSNASISLPDLVAPLHECARAQVETESDAFALVADDWSEVDYDNHTSKTDRIELNSTKRLGYLLHTALLLSDRTGMPIAPLHLSLRSQDGIHTTRDSRVLPHHPQVDEATAMMMATAGITLCKTKVFIFDRGFDSVGHFRQWTDLGQLFVVRANARPRVLYEGKQVALWAVAEQVDLRAGEPVDLSAGVIGQQFVGETQIVITRPAKPRKRNQEPGPRTLEHGEPVRLRLIVSEIRTPDEQVYARWMLLTNVADEVRAETIARWYLWRWKIESYFKLMKRGGQQLESWQQESADAIAKRLLVASMASVVVWQLARAQSQEAENARQLLVRLSGRQTRRDRPHSEPAMLAGIWVLLAMLDALEQYSVEELRNVARTVLLGFARYDPRE